MTHDTSKNIDTESLKKHWEDRAVGSGDQPLWHHQHSETFVTYKLINGVPEANNSADALYLCYLYLASHEHEKAWAVLNALSRKGIEGTPTELTYLSWIITALPVLLEDKSEDAPSVVMRGALGSSKKIQKIGKEADAIQDSPRDTACQLKALSLYTTLLESGKKPALPDASTCDLSTANGQYQSMQLEKTKVFYDTLPATIYTLYDRLQRTRRHVSETFTLEDTECRSLLNFYHGNGRTNSPSYGSLGYEWRRLNLKALLSEYRHLNAIRDSLISIPRALARRLHDIETVLEEHVPSMKKSTVLELCPIDLSLPDNFEIRRDLLKQADRSIVDSWSYFSVFNVEHAGKEMDAFEALSSGINESDFIHFFPHYAQAAIGHDEVKREKLRAFCVHYLMGHRHLSLDKQESIIPFLSNILYRMTENPSSFDARSSFRTVFEFAQKVSVTPIEIYEAQDVFREELTHNRAIWDDLMLETFQHDSMSTKPFQLPIDLTIQAVILASNTTKLEACLTAFANEERSYETELKKCVSLDNELAAGQLKYDCIQKQQIIALNGLREAPLRQDLKSQSSKIQALLEVTLTAQWEKTLALANRELKDALFIKIGAAQRHLLTKQELLKCYFDADPATYIESTGLNLIQANELHQMIHQCVTLEVERQHVTRLERALQKAEDEPDEPSHLDLIASVLMSQNQPEAQDDPTAMLFQYEENLLNW